MKDDMTEIVQILTVRFYRMTIYLFAKIVKNTQISVVMFDMTYTFDV